MGAPAVPPDATLLPKGPEPTAWSTRSHRAVAPSETYSPRGNEAPALKSVQVLWIPSGSSWDHVPANPPATWLVFKTESTAAAPYVSRLASGENAPNASMWYTRAR